MRNYRFYAPKYWPTWLGFMLLWGIARLPFKWQMGLGRALGRLLYFALPYRRRIADTNLQLCFPECSAAERQQWVVDNFKALGCAIIDLGMTWWTPAHKLEKRLEIKGLEHLNHAQKQGNVILLGAHFLGFDLLPKILQRHGRIAAIYRPSKNQLFEAQLFKHRQKIFEEIIDRRDLRAIIKTIKQGIPVWLAPDQDYGRKRSVFVPFFGVSAASVTSTSRLAKITKAQVLPVFQYRLENDRGYRVEIGPPLQDFPSDDVAEDTKRVNQIIERAILKAPAQYFWQHRRFKTRPVGEPSFYLARK